MATGRPGIATTARTASRDPARSDRFRDISQVRGARSMSMPERAWPELPEGYLSIPERLNTAEFVLDRHIAAGRGGRVALYAPPDRSVTFGELRHMVDRCGLGLQSLGV